jgi:lysophospholipase L1-like esterase
VSTFRRYVAIGDSATEGLHDLDESGAYRGWADRLAEHIAAAQAEPLEYANLAVRGLRLHEIRATQFERALELEPDLMSIGGGANDVIGPRPDFGQIAADLEAMFSAAADRGITVATFVLPDLSFVNPFGRYTKQRMIILNDITRAAAKINGVKVLDLTRYPVASDPRLWFEDRLHGNELGHTRMAAGFAHLLGIDGFDDWADPLPEPIEQAERLLARIGADLDWAVHWLGPWLGRGLTRVPHGRGVTAKRPVPEVIQAALSDRN